MVDAIPNVPRVYLSSFKKDTKAASKDIIQVDEKAVPIEEMTDLVFEDLAGQEIINISRHDLINGRNLSYNPISNISSITRQYNSGNIIPLHDSSPNLFNSFTIKLDRHIPEEYSSYDEFGNINYVDGASIYIDATTGDLVINVIDISASDQVEVQVLKSGQEEHLML